MAKIFVFFTILLVSAFSAFSQVKPADHSGKWTLDKAASTLDERSRIESMTMTVTQTAKELSFVTDTKRAAPPEGAQDGRGGRGFGGGGAGPTDIKNTYSLEGKETTVQQETPAGMIPVTLAAKFEGGKLVLNQTRTMGGPMGQFTLTSKEEWTLSANGKTLTIKKESSNPRGSFTSTLVFTKN